MQQKNTEMFSLELSYQFERLIVFDRGVFEKQRMMNEERRQMNKSFILMALIFAWFGLCLNTPAEAQTKTLTARDYFQRASELGEQLDLDDAIANYTKAIELDPNFTDAYTNRCSAYLQRQKNEEALADCNKAIQLDPKMWAAYYNRGMVYLVSQPFSTDALQDFSTVISLKADHSDAYYNRAMLYSNLQEYEKAVGDLTKIIESGLPDLSEYGKGDVFFARGRNYFDLNQDDLALRDYAEALKFGLYSVYKFRADIYLKQKQYDLAIQEYSTAIKVLTATKFFEPVISDYYRKRGLVYVGQSQWDLALADYTKAIQLSTQNYRNYKERAVIYRALNQTDLAAKDEETVRKLGW